MKRHNCGLIFVTLRHPLKWAAFTHAAFKGQFEEFTGLAFRRLVATFCEDDGNVAKPHGSGDKANFADFIVIRQRRVVRSTFIAEFHGLVDSIKQMLLLHCTLHHIYIYIYTYIVAQHKVRTE